MGAEWPAISFSTMSGGVEVPIRVPSDTSFGLGSQ